MPETSLPVEHLFTITATTQTAGLIANGPHGTRLVVGVTGGSFEGPRMKGTIKGPADDGALILMHYSGVFAHGATYIRSAPVFETGDERYAWINDVLAIGLGSVGEGSVTYEVYQVL